MMTKWRQEGYDDGRRLHGGRRESPTEPTTDDQDDDDQLLPQLVAHLREHRTKLREEWAQPDPGSASAARR